MLDFRTLREDFALAAAIARLAMSWIPPAAEGRNRAINLMSPQECHSVTALVEP